MRKRRRAGVDVREGKVNGWARTWYQSDSVLSAKLGGLKYVRLHGRQT